MKFFITALVILAAVGVFCAWGSAESIGRIDVMIETLGDAEAADENVPYNASDVTKRFSDEWDRNMFLISMFLPHHHLDEVKEKLVALKAYADTDEFAEWQEAKLLLEEELFHIRGLIGVSADNIL